MANAPDPAFLDLHGRSLLALVALIALGWLLWLAHGVAVPFGFVLLLVATLHPFVVRAERRGLRRSYAVGLVMAVFVLAPIALAALLAPLIVAEIRSLAAQAPALQLRFDQLLRNWGLATQVETAIAHANIQTRLETLALVSARQITIVMIKAAVVVFATGYVLADGERLLLLLHTITPRRWERHIAPLLNGLEGVVGGYILGQVITSVLFGVFATLLCFALRVPSPLLMGLVAAIGDIIPLFGIQLAMLLTMLVAFTHSTWQPAGVFAGYVVYGQLEAHLLVPRIYARTVSLPALLVLLATLLGATLDGLVGIIVGIPLAGGIKVFVSYVHAQRMQTSAPTAATATTAVPAPPIAHTLPHSRAARVVTSARLHRRSGGRAALLRRLREEQRH
jgi:predicted PurR-regulated permease PerM